MRNILRTSAALLTVAALSTATTVPALAADSAELAALRAQVSALEQQLKILARQIEIKDEAAAASAATGSKLTVNDRGATVASNDGLNSVRLRGLVQMDNRVFFDDGGGINNNAFILRRARLITEGVFAKNYAFQLITEFGGSSVSILDASLTATVTKELQFKIGKFKYPIGLELLQSDAWTFFNERSVVTNLVPNRDLGVQAQGDLLDGRLSYQAGIFNGVADGASTNNSDFDEEKDVAARLWATPFKNEAGSPVQGLSVGIAGSIGRQKTASGRSGGFRTDGQQTFFAYNAAAVADGKVWRIAPQLDYRRGSLGILSEYVASTVNLRPSATGPITELTNKAWQVSAGYVLTGEDSSYNGVVPRVNFDLAAGTWGAFEVVGRVGNLKVDNATFPTFASAAGNAQEVDTYGLGLNWYLGKATMLKIDYYQNEFGFSPLAPATPTSAVIRQDEKAFITRFQLTF